MAGTLSNYSLESPLLVRYSIDDLLSVAPTGITATENPICSGNSTTLSISDGSLGTGATWYWYEGGCGVGTSIGTGTSISVSSSSTTTYFIRAEGTCHMTPCVSITITVNPTPTLTFSDALVTCEMSDGTVTADPSDGTSPYTYLWDDAGNQTTQTATGLAAGTYTVTVTDAANCTVVQQASIVCTDFFYYDCHSFLDCDVFTNDPDITDFYVVISKHNSSNNDCSGSILGTPYSTFYPNNTTPPTGSQCDGWWTTALPALGLLVNTTNLTDDYGVPIGGPSGYDYSFELHVSKDGGQIFKLYGRDCILAPNPICDDPPATKMADENNNVVSDIINTQANFNYIYIYPNPAQNELTIFVSQKSDKMDLEIFTIKGDKIISQKSVNANQPLRFDISAWSDGIYYCRIKSDESYSFKRFTVIK